MLIEVDWQKLGKAIPAPQAADERLFPARNLYSELEIEHLRTLFDLCEDVGAIDALLDDMGVVRWFYDEGIDGVHSQKLAIRGILRKRQRELEATRDLRAVVSVEPSKELARSRLVRRQG